MSKNPLISIIVPMYNAESTIGSCIDSILAQTYSNIEVLLIDDGSIDGTARACSPYRTDSRIRYRYQKNAGVSIARNLGLNIATGKYVAFVDSDDKVSPSFISSMVETAQQFNTDLVYCGYVVQGSNLRLNDTNNLIAACHGQKNGFISPEEALRRTISTNPNYVLYGYIWRNLFSKEIIDKYNIRFIEKVHILEDFQFLINYLLRSTKVGIIAQNLYCYKINEGSVTSKYIPSLHSDMYSINKWMEDTVLKQYPLISNGLIQCIANTYLGSVQNVCRSSTPYSIIKRIKYAYKLKKEYKYSFYIKESVKYANRRKAQAALYLFKYNFEWLYIILFSIKEHLK